MAFFKKKYSYPAHTMIMNKGAAAEAAPSYGDTPLGRAMAKAVAAIDARVGAGKMSAANASGYKARVNALQPMVGGDEEPGLLQAAQIIGAVNKSV
ncbi:MAG: hypothetical protein FWF40_02455 [Methanomassiliicoccaceae archaeon]|nr:hypothetical protein [Methanomassiliicoccaceae archaeon]